MIFKAWPKIFQEKTFIFFSPIAGPGGWHLISAQSVLIYIPV